VAQVSVNDVKQGDRHCVLYEYCDVRNVGNPEYKKELLKKFFPVKWDPPLNTLIIVLTSCLFLQKSVPVEVGLLRFLYSSIQRSENSAVDECWPLLLALLRDSFQLNITPPGLFALVK
jgi:hypothetical protein